MGAQATALERNVDGRPEAKIPPRHERLGGVRADFVATLGRRVVELKSALGQLEEEPSSAARRDELRRRVHALAAAARLLRFNKLAEELMSSEALVDRVATRGELTGEDTQSLRSVLDRLPELAWGEASLAEPDPFHDPPPRSQEPRSTGAPRTLPSVDRIPAKLKKSGQPAVPQTILVVGHDAIGDALAPDSNAHNPTFEIEQTEDDARVPDLARALAPDVIIIDADRPGARDLVAALIADPLTEEVPIILLGQWQKSDEAALYVALGVARTLPKPVSPDALRRAIGEVASSYVRREIVRAPIGQVSLDQLGARLAEELRRGLCDAADPRARSASLDLGEGSEVLAALWGAVARIRDVVTIQSHGKVRFAPRGPEGALPIAPWIGGPEQVGQGARTGKPGEVRGAELPSLDGLSVVVADDDAAVTWFLTGVLRAAGARVREAHDGQRAFELCCEAAPDLVISDIIMPGLDGFALCRAIKRDFALRDVPVVLLSWKEDLLQRVRELGAGADAYLRKEASAAAIVHRVREVLRPRLRVAQRLAQGGEVRGRLEGLTPRTLLALACAQRPASTLTVRDALYLYEVEIRDGRPARATRTTADGSFERGPGVLARLLGVGAGRFVVAPVPEGDPRMHGARADLSGSLAEQLVAPVAAARAAQRLLSGASMMNVERVEIDLSILGASADAMPQPARALLRSIAAGTSPSALARSGKAAPYLIEDVLCDAAAHGAITVVLGEGGVDLLTPAVELESERLRGVRRPPPPVEVPSLSQILPTPVPGTPQPISEVIDRSATPAPVQLREESSPQGAPAETLFADEDEIEEVSAVPDPTLDVRPVSVAREASPVPAPVAPVIIAPPPVLAPSPRALSPLPAPVLVAPPVEPAPPPPRPSLIALSPPPPAPVVAAAPAPEPRPQPAPRQLSLGSLSPPPVAEIGPKIPSAHVPLSRRDEPTPEPTDATPVNRRRVRKPWSSPPPEPTSAPPRRDSNGRVSVWILCAVAGIVFAVGSRVSHQRAVAQAQAAQAQAEAAQTAAPAVEAPTAAPTAEPAPVAHDRREGDTVDFPVLPQDLPLKAEDKVPAGQGMLEIIAGPSDTIFVDGAQVGSGPIIKAPFAPKKDPYEIRVRLRGEERVRFAVVKEGRLTRLRIAPPWSR
jgi:CheY-like chemotaxis protein